MGCGSSVSSKFDGDMMIDVMVDDDEEDTTTISSSPSYVLTGGSPMRFSQFASKSFIKYIQINDQRMIYTRNDSTRNILMKALKKIFIFESTANEQIEKLIDNFKPITCKEEDNIIKQGTRGDFMYIIESGSFLVLKNNEILSKTLRCGDSFGELSLLYHAKRSATVQCKRVGLIWALDRQTFQNYLHLNNKQRDNLISKCFANVPVLKNLDSQQRIKFMEIADIVEFQEEESVNDNCFYFILDGVVKTSQFSHFSFSSSDSCNQNCKPIQQQQQAIADDFHLIVAEYEDEEYYDVDNNQKSIVDLDKSVLKSSALSSSSVSDFNIKILKSGEWFGEDAFYQQPNNTSYVADTHLTLVKVDGHMFEKVLGNMQDIIDQNQYKELLLKTPPIATLLSKEAGIRLFSLEDYSDFYSIANFGDENAKFIYVKSGSVYLIRDDKEVIYEAVNLLAKLSSLSFSSDDRNRLNDLLLMSATEIGPGEHVGAPELIDGTPMKFMVLSKGETQCYVLCANEYGLLQKTGSTKMNLMVKSKSIGGGDVKQDSFGFYLLLELVQGGELKRLIYCNDESSQRIRRKQEVGLLHEPAKFYIAGVSLALAHLHRRCLIHRDLKPDTIKIDRFGYPKLTQFGLAKCLDFAEDGKTYTMCGTPEYIAPEVIMGKGHGQPVDWWALGVVLYELIVGTTPFVQQGVDRNKHEPMHIFQSIISNSLRCPDYMEPECRDFIQRLLTTIPSARMGCGFKAHKEFEQHAWLRDTVDWHALKKHRVNPPWMPALRDNTDITYLKP